MLAFLLLLLNSSKECMVMDDVEMNDILPSGSRGEETKFTQCE